MNHHHLHRRSLILIGLFVAWPVLAAGGDDEARIRAIVASMLAAKDAQIARLEARVRQLEARVNGAVKAPAPSTATLPEHGTPLPAQDPARAASPAAAGAQSHRDPPGLAQKLESLESGLKDLLHGDRLDISGFFDMLARSENEGERPFDLGAFELDLGYSFMDQFAVSSALVWDGAGSNVAVAVIDYHLYDHRIPARGRIFTEPGFHLQAGRFDLPFSSDFQFFAATDRLTLTAPLTTSRIQQGGFNSDGLRVYGSGRVFNYAFFSTDSIYENAGRAWGGRIGLGLGRNPFRLHSGPQPSVIEAGLSSIVDLDADGGIANIVYALDARFSYGPLSLLGEALLRDAQRPLVDGNGAFLAERDEYAYHLTLNAELGDVLPWPLALFLRYGAWVPDYRRVLDANDDTISYRVDNISRVSLGLAYAFNDNLKLKFEYFDTLGDRTAEPGFENRLGLGQLVVSF